MSQSQEVLRPDNGGERSEEERSTVARFRELDRKSEGDLKAFFELLTHPKNIEHFSNPPTDYLSLRDKLTRDNTKAYLAENSLGEIVGGGGINDAQEGEHDHWLVKVAVKPELQGKGIGKQLVVRLVDEAFNTKTSDGRERGKLVVSIIRNVQGWWRTPDLFGGLDFRPLHIMMDEVDVFVQDIGRTIKKPTERWEIRRTEWQHRKQKTDVKRILPHRNGNDTVTST